VRVRVIFLTENVGAAIPFHHQFILSKLVKEMIASHPDFSGFKHYCFSGVKGQNKVSRDGLQILSNKVTIVFSSFNKDFLEYLVGKIFSYRRIDIGNLRLKPDCAEVESSFSSSDNKVKYLCISPITTGNPRILSYDSQKYIKPGTDEFSDAIFEQTMISMEKSGLYTPTQLSSFFRFQIVPDADYLAKLQDDEKKISRVYYSYIDGKKLEVRGYTIPFALYAEKEVHDYIINVGVGSLNQEGFGMVDIPFSEFKKETSSMNIIRV
jgi:CRISPR-associated endoribonuclease Cas6